MRDRIIKGVTGMFMVMACAMTMTASRAAHAQEISGGFATGSVIFGYDTVCNAGAAGAVRYNSATAALEYCNGSAWASAGAAPPCANDSSGVCALAATRSNSDPDFTAANICYGRNILGVTGTNATCVAQTCDTTAVTYNTPGTYLFIVPYSCGSVTIQT